MYMCIVMLEQCLGLSVWCITKAYRGILYNCVVSTSWQPFRKKITYKCDGQMSTNFKAYGAFYDRKLCLTGNDSIVIVQ